MNKGKTIFSQIMSLIPERDFKTCVDRYKGNYRARNFSCRVQFLVMSYAQLTGRDSLRDIEKGDMLKSRRYRNRRLGDFLKELDLTEGRSTGVPTIQTKLAENGSPRAIFETTDDRLTFLVTIPVREGCGESSETDILGSERGSERKTKSSERSMDTKDLIIDIIKQDPHITAAEIAMQLNMSSRGVEKQIRKLRELGKIKRTGGRFGGYWEIVILNN